MPSLGRGAFKPVFDICLRDRELRTAVQDVGIGRWVGVRELLERTGADWDRRTHRIRVLADAAAGGKCVETWQVAQPESVDAMVLRAEVEVVRVFRVVARDGTVATMRLDSTVESCIAAAKAAPTDPVPVVSLLTIARLYPGGQREIDSWWGEMQQRDPFNREACHQVLRYFSTRYHGSATMVQNFARECAQRAPHGSPLTVLPLVARVEEFKASKGRQDAADLALNDIWIDDGAMYDLDVAMDRCVPAPCPRVRAGHPRPALSRARALLRQPRGARRARLRGDRRSGGQQSVGPRRGRRVHLRLLAKQGPERTALTEPQEHLRSAAAGPPSRPGSRPGRGCGPGPGRVRWRRRWLRQSSARR